MSPTIEASNDNSPMMTIGPDDDFIMIKIEASGAVTVMASLGEDDAVDLLRELADGIEVDGFEPMAGERIN